MHSDALQDLRYGGSGDAIPTVAINAAGGLFFAALFTADQRAADTRISRRDKVPCLADGPAAFLILTGASDTRHFFAWRVLAQMCHVLLVTRSVLLLLPCRCG